MSKNYNYTLIRNRHDSTTFCGLWSRLFVFVIITTICLLSEPPVYSQTNNPVPILQTGHGSLYGSSYIKAVFSPDQKFLVTGGEDGTIKIWDRNGLLLNTINAHNSAIGNLSLSSDGRLLLSKGADKQVSLWQVQTGRLIKSFEFQGEFIGDIALSPKGNVFAVCEYDVVDAKTTRATVKLRDVQTGDFLATVKSDITQIVFSPSGNDFAFEDSGTIKIWSVPSKNVRAKLSYNLRPPAFFAFDKSGERLVSLHHTFNQDKKLLFWNLDDETISRQITIGNAANFLSISSDWEHFATLTGYNKPNLQFWQTKSGTLVSSTQIESNILSHEFVSEVFNLLVQGENGMQVVSINTSGEGAKPLTKPFGKTPNFTTGSAFSKTGRLIAWGSHNSIFVWDVSTATLLYVMQGHADRINQVAFSPDEQSLVSCSDSEVKVWSLVTGRFIRNISVYGTLKNVESGVIEISSIAFSPDGKTLAVGGDKTSSVGGVYKNDFGVKLVNFYNGKLLRSIKVPFVNESESKDTPRVYSIAISPNGKHLVAAAGDKFVRLWNIQTGKLVNTLQGHTDFALSVAFSPDGKKIASGSFDNTARLWDVRTGKVSAILKSHSNYVSSVKFSTDGKYVITGSYDKTLKVWNAESGGLVNILQDHTGAVTSVAVNPNGLHFASSSVDGKINFWSPLNNSLISTLLATPDKNWISFTPEGYYKGTSGAESYLAWRIGDKISPSNANYRDSFAKAEIVENKLRGQLKTPGNTSEPPPLPPSQRELKHPEVTKLPSKDKRWAIIIGVDNYKSSNITTLYGAENDARALANAIQLHAGFDKDNIILMTTSAPEGECVGTPNYFRECQPTRTNILSIFAYIKNVLPKDGLLLFSFAGHGIEKDGIGFLISSDTVSTEDLPLLLQTAVNVQDLKNQIKGEVQQAIFLLDACRYAPPSASRASGSDNVLTESYKRKFILDDKNKEIEAFALLFATSVGSLAYEDKNTREKRRGYFSLAVVKAISGGAANENGEVTLGNLIRYVQTEVPKNAGIDGRKQKPFAEIYGFKADELVIAIVDKGRIQK